MKTNEWGQYIWDMINKLTRKMDAASRIKYKLRDNSQFLYLSNWRDSDNIYQHEKDWKKKISGVKLYQN